MVTELFIDGACRGNPGEAAIGVVLNQNGKTVKTISRAIGQATNNIAEYAALIYGLQEALIMRAEQIKVHTDSELLFHQVNGNYKIKNTNLKFLHALVKHLLGGFRRVEVHRIPREQNREADKLATQAIKKEAKVVTPMFIIGEESPSSKG